MDVHEAQALKLYEILADEIERADSQSYQVVVGGLAGIAALIGFGLKEKDLQLAPFLMTYLIIFFGLRLLCSNRIRIWRASTYQRRFLEPDLPKVQWQTKLAALGSIKKLNSSAVVSNHFDFFITVNIVVTVLFAVSLWSSPDSARYEFIAICVVSCLGLVRYAFWLLKRLKRGGDVEREYYHAWK